MVLADIFDKLFGQQQVEGLIDSEDDKEFELGFEILSKKWGEMDATFTILCKMVLSV